MKEEVNIFADTDETYEPKYFDYLVTHEPSTKQTLVTIGADIDNDKVCGVALVLTKDSWLKIVKEVQEVLDAWEEEDEAQMG